MVCKDRLDEYVVFSTCDNVFVDCYQLQPGDGGLGHGERDDRTDRMGRRPLEQVTCFKVSLVPCFFDSWVAVIDFEHCCLPCAHDEQQGC